MSGNIKTWACQGGAEELHLQINDLARQCVEQNTFPYFNEKPLAQDINVLNGRYLADINKVTLELKAAAIGAKSLAWIYGADAAMLGLELKDNKFNDLNLPGATVKDILDINPDVAKEQHIDEYQNALRRNSNFDTDPIIVYANVKERIFSSKEGKINEADIPSEGMRLDAQCVYLLDQFTEESINRCINKTKLENLIEKAGNEEAKNQFSSIKHAFLDNIVKSRTGKYISEKRTKKEIARRDDRIRNFKENRKNKIEEINSNEKKLRSGLSPEQNSLFDYVNLYNLQQLTTAPKSLNMINQLEKNLPEAKRALNIMLSKNGGDLARLLGEVYLHDERQVHKNFSFNYQYEQNEDKARVYQIIRPDATKFFEYKEKETLPRSFLSEEKMKELKTPDRQYRPKPKGIKREGR